MNPFENIMNILYFVFHTVATLISRTINLFFSLISAAFFGILILGVLAFIAYWGVAFLFGFHMVFAPFLK